MRRYLFPLLSVLAVAAAIPAIAAGHSGDHRRDRNDRARDRVEVRHRRHRRDDRVEHFRAHDARAGIAADAGTVKSFNAGVLTITLNDRTAVRGLVNRSTEVECEAIGDHFTRDDGWPGPSSGGGDNGDHHDQGDDRGDRGDRNDDNDAIDNDANDNDANANPQACATALRTPGTHVRDATLKLTRAGAVWDSVELDA